MVSPGHILPASARTGSGGSQGSGSSSNSNNGLAPEKPPERISSRSDGNGQISMHQLTDVMQNITPLASPPPLPPRLASVSHGSESRNMTATNGSGSPSNNSTAGDEQAPDYDTVYGHQDAGFSAMDGNPNDAYDTGTGFSSSSGTNKWKVSAKIQQLLNTLKRPKKRPLPDFYVDDEADLEISPLDPNSPRPEGSTSSTTTGDPLSVPSGLPRSLEAALQRYGSATFKAPAVTVLDTGGKISPALTYGKLYSRSRKIAYNLLNKIGQKGSGGGGSVGSEVTIKAGDRIALVYPNNDPVGFMCSFYGCLTAGVVPVPIEVPVTRRDAGSQQIGFLLGSCSVGYALTSDSCFKALPRSATGDVLDLKGWPKLIWLVTESWSKPSKEWQPPPRVSEETPAYIEYTVDREGAMKGVAVSRAAMMNQARALTAACSYTEGDLMVSVLDFKREVGLWHAVLATILNGMHIVFVPYSLMKVNPSSWMMMITKFKATVAICKSRDLHWGLLATRDHKDVNLSSLRMLLVADGSNPWR